MDMNILNDYAMIVDFYFGCYVEWLRVILGIDLYVIIGQIGGVKAEGFRSHPEMNADVNVILAHDFRQLFCIPGDALTLFENRDAFKVNFNNMNGQWNSS